VGAPAAASPAAQAEALSRAAQSPDEPGPAAEPASEATAHDGGQAPLPVEHYDDLDADEVISLLDSLESADLLVLRDHERAGHSRASILAAIDAVMARREIAQSR
jgi:hypothetical protein